MLLLRGSDMSVDRKLAEARAAWRLPLNRKFGVTRVQGSHYAAKQPSADALLSIGGRYAAPYLDELAARNGL
jgi:hypothetical protein